MKPASGESEPFAYCGNELELFSRAENWKSYLHSQIAPYLGPKVLEVGAGLGTTARALCRKSHERWTLLEPDPALAQQAALLCDRGALPACCDVRIGTSESISESFDTILYIDVLEHIDDDLTEFRRAAGLLAPGGYLVVLCPAHQFLYSEFDRQIGHFRRHSRRTYRRLIDDRLRCVRLRYLDSVGVLASLANRMLLRQSTPTARQIAFWDTVLVRCSRFTDPLTGYQLGKSILGIWQRVG